MERESRTQEEGRNDVENDDQTLGETSSDESPSDIESTSSEGSSSEDDETRITATSKNETDADLKSRLAAFLPQMKKANQDLTNAEQIDDVGEDEQHIEMSLGLGVLEEKKNGDSDIRHRASSSERESEEEIPPPKKRKISVIE